MDSKDFLKSILRGVGQVMLQKNAVTGIFFLIGIFYASSLAGISALVGVIVSTLTAIILKYDKKDIEDGLYGFNGVLVGIAMSVMFISTTALLAVITAGAVVSTLVMHYMHKHKMSPYTFPFVLTTWIAILLINKFQISPAVSQGIISNSPQHFLWGVSFGFSEVMLLSSVVTGIFFLIGIWINSRLFALHALIGSIVGMSMALLFFPELQTMAYLGYFGFNAVLASIVFTEKKLSSLIFSLIPIAFSVVITGKFIQLGLPGLTAPFVFAVWLTFYIKKHHLRLKMTKV